MSTDKLYIPDRIKVGYNNRTDTFTGALAYVIYYDNKGILRKETSWEYWRDKKIEPNEFENEPTSGFVLNKKVGGARESYGWNARNEYCRIYDPRGFEFEISFPNLLFILQECDCLRGKGLEGEFVYSWSGTELVLLPTKTEDYQKSRFHTQLIGESVSAKELKEGATYLTKNQETWTYLGKFNYHFCIVTGRYYHNTPKNKLKGVEKRHIFWNGKQHLVLTDVKQIARLQSEVPLDNYAELVEQYNKSPHGSRVKSLTLKPGKEIDLKKIRIYYWYKKDNEGKIREYKTYYQYGGDEIEYISRDTMIHIKDGNLIIEYDREAHAYPGGRKNDYMWYSYHTMDWVEPTNLELYVVMENGSEYKFNDYSFER